MDEDSRCEYFRMTSLALWEIKATLIVVFI
jgi:hypothetical protein